MKTAVKGALKEHIRWMSSKRTVVMSFGDGSHGSLGLAGIGVDAYEPTPVPSLPSDISSISAGHYHSLAVTSQGELWAWGRNQEGQLGRGLHASRHSWQKPKKVEGLSEVKVQAAFASGVISAVIGDDGSLWVWGKSKRGQLGLGKDITEAMLPSRVEALSGEKIVKLSLGWGHVLALTKNGKLFGWGYSADGRIGQNGKILEKNWPDLSADKLHISRQLTSSTMEASEQHALKQMDGEKNMPIIWKPCLMQELQCVEVVDVACGLDHSLVLCRNGTLLSGGSNIYGQLGREVKDSGLQPVVVSKPFLPSNIAAGLGHSLAVCEDDRGTTNLLSWGWNQSFQLGRSGPETVPVVVDRLEGESVISVSGGRAHSMALTSKGEVWVWGSGRNGRLGLGSSIDETEPSLLECLEGFQALQAVSGFDHNLLLVSE